jgi:hypothetical protein
MKGKTVYIILYNYSDSNYSIIRTMEKLDEAYDYICNQEKDSAFGMLRLIHVKDEADIREHLDEHKLNVCYITTDDYNVIDIQKYYGYVSSYVIISTLIY